MGKSFLGCVTEYLNTVRGFSFLSAAVAARDLKTRRGLMPAERERGSASASRRTKRCRYLWRGAMTKGNARFALVAPTV